MTYADPVTLPHLLDAIDFLERSSAPLNRFNLQNYLKCTPKRLAEYLRVLDGAQLIHLTENNIELTCTHKQFIDAWNVADTSKMSKILANYQPYKRLLNCIATEKIILVPQTKESKSNLRDWLKPNYQLNFVAFDTLWKWAHALDRVYFAHLNNLAVYWGGCEPTIEAFGTQVKESWRRHHASDGFARISLIAEDTCTSLLISLRQFELLFRQLIIAHGREIYISSSALRHKQKKWELQFLLPRKEVMDRAAMTSNPPLWVQRRFLEDGILVGKHYFRLLKWGNGS